MKICALCQALVVEPLQMTGYAPQVCTECDGRWRRVKLNPSLPTMNVRQAERALGYFWWTSIFEFVIIVLLLYIAWHLK